MRVAVGLMRDPAARASWPMAEPYGRAGEGRDAVSGCSHASHGRERRENNWCWRPHGTPTALLIHTRSGNAMLRADGGQRTMSEGDTVVWAPGTPHDFGCRGDVDWELVWAHFRPPEQWHDWLTWPSVAAGITGSRRHPSGCAPASATRSSRWMATPAVPSTAPTTSPRMHSSGPCSGSTRPIPDHSSSTIASEKRCCSWPETWTSLSPYGGWPRRCICPPRASPMSSACNWERRRRALSSSAGSSARKAFSSRAHCR